MNKVETAVLATVGIIIAIGSVLAAYNIGFGNAMERVAESKLPPESVQVWTGLVRIPTGKKVRGTVYEVAMSGRPLVRYTIENGNPNPYIVTF